LLSMLPMLLIFAAVFYFLLIRPQSKRAKEQKEMMSGLQLGDEILTSGGVVGKVSKLRDGYISVIIAKDTEVMLQKNAIATVLPKGTLELG
jgi:preprotein translocase subunit YajC